jgi:hypothetical protein
VSNVPAYVYLILALLIWLGISRCYPRRMHPARLLIAPAVLLGLGLNGFFGLFPAPLAIDLLTAGAGGVLGFGLGWWRTGRWPVAVDRTAQRIAVPGDPAMLAILLGSFAFQFALRYGMASGAGWATEAFVQPLAAAVAAWFAGLAAGSGARLLARYCAAPAAAVTA